MLIFQEKVNGECMASWITNLTRLVSVIQYALLISFIYGFPLGPMCCLIQNVLSLRMEAIDMIYESRRPAYTRQSQGIGIWNTVLMTLTHVGGMINVRINFQ